MREIRPSGSEGGEAESIGLPYPYPPAGYPAIVLVQPELESECACLTHCGRRAVRFLRHGGML
jgi:hypothetical protein